MIKQLRYFLLVVILGIVYPLKSPAQVVPDNTLGSESSKINSIDELRSRIEGGAIRGDNLFHSFEEFGVAEEASVDFANPDGIANIFSRVTGSNLSDISGSLGVDGTANLFLMNPNGIIFGENAAINVNGSFLATTAETINFSDGSQFSSIEANSSKPSLTVSVPTSLGFGSNPGDISIRGEQNNVLLEIPSFRVITDNLPSEIKVNPEQNISLIGGNITFNGGGLQAPGGKIELHSIGSNQTLKLLPTDDWLVADLSSISEFKDISLNNAAYIDVSDERAGNVNVSGRQIILDDGSVILANTSLDTNNAINIKALELLELRGTFGGGEQNVSFLPGINRIIEEGVEGIRDINGRGNSYSVSLIAADVISDSNGNGTGNAINIDANQINVIEGAQIRTVNFSSVETSRLGGDIKINSQDLVVKGTNVQDKLVSSLITSTNGISRFGNTGNIEINSRNVRLLDGGQIKVDSYGRGKIGILDINSDYLAVKGFTKSDFSPGSPFVNRSLIGTSAASDGIEGDRSGTINIETDILDVIEGGSIGSNSFGRNAAGEINIKAEKISLIGLTDNSNFQPTTVSATVIRDSPSPVAVSTINENSSNAGDINIDTDQLQVLNGASIAANSNSGNSGSIKINAQDIELNGTRPDNRGRVGGLSTSTAPKATGDGGDIRINTNSLKILNGSVIRAISLGEGDAGNINITAKSIEIAGFDRFAKDPIASKRVSKINTGALKLNGGNITIDSDSIEVKNLATIQATTEEGSRGGNIILNTDNLQLLDQGQITASAGGSGNGGNVTIDSNTILGLNNSDITANAVGGNGGNIEINTERILGLESRQRLTSASDITASSEFGIDGTVTINSPESNIEEDAVVVFKNYIPQTNRELISGTCLDPNRESGGKLVYVGRGGVPENPYNFFDDEEIVAIEGVAEDKPASSHRESGSSSQQTNSGKLESPVWSQGEPIINANAVKVGADGQTYLVAETQLEDVQSQVCSSSNFKQSQR